MNNQQRLLSHICQRIAGDVDLLVDIGSMGFDDGEAIKGKLPWDSSPTDAVSSLNIESRPTTPDISSPKAKVNGVRTFPKRTLEDYKQPPNRQPEGQPQSAVQQAAAYQNQTQQSVPSQQFQQNPAQFQQNAPQFPQSPSQFQQNPQQPPQNQFQQYNNVQSNGFQQQQQDFERQQNEQQQMAMQQQEMQAQMRQEQPPALPQRNQPPPNNRPRRKVKALYDYVSQQEGDLNFMKGDIIEILSEDNQHWSTGKLGENTGLLPTNHVIPFSTTLPQCNVYTSRPSMATGHYVQQYSKNAPHSVPQANHSNPNPALNITAAPQYGANNEKAYALPQDVPTKAPLPERPQVLVQQPKRQFGNGLGKTLLHSGVGGLGFGAGSALTANAINAIL